VKCSSSKGPATAGVAVSDCRLRQRSLTFIRKNIPVC
jgi:hypothetical protein